MIELTPAARQQLDDYLQRMRSELRAKRADVADEVEQSVREHIEIALENVPAPVSGTDMIAILDRLGSPQQWLDEEERPTSRDDVQHATDNSRLPYLSIGLVLFAISTFMFYGFFLLIPAMFVSRAWVEQKRERGEELGSKRWLVYPAIALVLAFAALLFLLFPAVGAMALFLGDHGGRQFFDVPVTPAGDLRFVGGFRSLIFGVWWMIVGALGAALIRPIRYVFVPLLDRVRRKHFAMLSAIGALLAAAGATLIYFRH